MVCVQDEDAVQRALEPSEFTPTASPAAPKPKLLDVACHGVRVRVTDPGAAQPFALGLRLLAALRRHAEFAWVREGAWLDTLSGTRSLRAAFERGDSVETILAAAAPTVEGWRRERQPYLLY